MLAHWKENCNKHRHHVIKQRHHFANKGPNGQSYGFPVVMYECESWTIKKAEHQKADSFELWHWRRLLSPLDCKEMKLVNPKGNQLWILIGRTDREAEAPILWPPDVKSQLTGKASDAGEDWRLKEKGVTEDEMVGWHHPLSGHEFEQCPRNSGSLECCSPWGRKESDMT